MKAIIITVIAINCMFFSCKKNGHGPLIQGKLVHSSCASDVVQILDSTQYHLGQASWQQSPNEPVYQNVFVVSNGCYFKGQGIDEGDVFTFQLTSDSDNGCAICALWDNPPSVSRKIVVVSK